MKIVAPFGFVTGCHAGDKFMVQGTLASMRQYCPKVPICLVVDGNTDVRELQQQYKLIILRIEELSDTRMRKLIAGSTRSKMAAMWEGPFEHYVWLDSDAIVWGDFTDQVRRDVDFQIFWSEVSIPHDAREIPPWLPHYYFDPHKILEVNPEFEWRGLPYFCDGVFACRRGALTLDELEVVMECRVSRPGLWPASFNCMPYVNYLFHSKQQRGELNVAMADLQHIWLHHGRKEIETDCAGSGWRFPANIQRPRVLHFCGQKPYLYNRHGYSRPFTIARLEHHLRMHGEVGAWAEMLKEEAGDVATKLRKRMTAKRSRDVKFNESS